PDSRYLAVHYEWGRRYIYVWDLSRREAILKVSQGGYNSFPSFSSDSQLVALARPGHSIRIYELPSGATWKDLPPGPPVDLVRFHPDGRLLAVVTGSIVRLSDLNSGKEVAMFEHSKEVRSLAWRSDGKVFATGGPDQDSNIYLWEVTNPAQPLRVLK